MIYAAYAMLLDGTALELTTTALLTTALLDMGRPAATYYKSALILQSLQRAQLTLKVVACNAVKVELASGNPEVNSAGKAAELTEAYCGTGAVEFSGIDILAGFNTASITCKTPVDVRMSTLMTRAPLAKTAPLGRISSRTLGPSNDGTAPVMMSTL